MKAKKLGALLGLFSIIFIWGALALAQAASPSPAPVVPDQSIDALLPQILAAFASGKLAVAISGIVLIFTYLFRKLVVDPGKVGSGALPWVSLALGALFGVASNVFLGASPASAASAILLSGPIASSIWSSILKLIVKKQA